jgi:hypothetical protein
VWDECTKVGPKKEPNSYISQIEVFPFKMFLNLPLENFFCGKRCVSILKGQEGTHVIWLMWYRRKCCRCAVYIVFTLNPKFSGKYLYRTCWTSSRCKGTPKFAWWITKKNLALCSRQYHITVLGAEHSYILGLRDNCNTYYSCYTARIGR